MNNPIQDQKWRDLTVEGVLTISLPENAEIGFDDDQTLIKVRLNDAAESEILIGVFPLPDSQTVDPQILLNRLTYFMEECVKVSSHVSYDDVQDLENDEIAVFQSVAMLPNNRWWIARVYGQLGSPEFMLVHWNGNDDVLRSIVIRILFSIDPSMAFHENG